MDCSCDNDCAPGNSDCHPKAKAPAYPSSSLPVRRKGRQQILVKRPHIAVRMTSRALVPTLVLRPPTPEHLDESLAIQEKQMEQKSIESSTIKQNTNIWNLRFATNVTVRNWVERVGIRMTTTSDHPQQSVMIQDVIVNMIEQEFGEHDQMKETFGYTYEKLKYLVIKQVAIFLSARPRVAFKPREATPEAEYASIRVDIGENRNDGVHSDPQAAEEKTDRKASYWSARLPLSFLPEAQTANGRKLRRSIKLENRRHHAQQSSSAHANNSAQIDTEQGTVPFSSSQDAEIGGLVPLMDSVQMKD